MLPEQKHCLLLDANIGNHLLRQRVSEMIDDGIMLKKIQPRPDEKKTYGRLICFPLARYIIDGRNARAD
jgi:hypothetical protein